MSKNVVPEPAPKRRPNVKLQAKPRKVNEARKEIISFRLRGSEAGLLIQDMRANTMTATKSVKQFCRKLAIDFARGRLVYVEAVDRTLDPDSRDMARKIAGIPAPQCQITDARFLESLLGYLRTPKEWHLLRFFMLQAGWNDGIASKYKATKNEKIRLRIARRFLEEMLKQAKLTHQ